MRHPPGPPHERCDLLLTCLPFHLLRPRYHRFPVWSFPALPLHHEPDQARNDYYKQRNTDADVNTATGYLSFRGTRNGSRDEAQRRFNHANLRRIVEVRMKTSVAGTRYQLRQLAEDTTKTKPYSMEVIYLLPNWALLRSKRLAIEQ